MGRDEVYSNWHKRQRSDDLRINQEDNTSKTIETHKRETTTIYDDSCDLFGTYIVNELRTLDESTQTEVKHKINHIIYEAKLGKFQKKIPPPVLDCNDTSPEAPQDIGNTTISEQILEHEVVYLLHKHSDIFMCNIIIICIIVQDVNETSEMGGENEEVWFDCDSIVNDHIDPTNDDSEAISSDETSQDASEYFSGCSVEEMERINAISDYSMSEEMIM